MIKNIFKRLTDDLKEHYKLYIFYIIILIVSIIPVDYYIFSPGGLINIEDRIIIDNSFKSEGSFNMTYVTSRNATIMTYLLSYIIPNWDKVALNTRRIDNESKEDILSRGQVYLKETSYDAVIAAFKEAGKDYKIKSNNLTITHIFSYANTNVQVGDIIKSINNEKVNSGIDISNILLNFNENDEIKITVLRGNKVIDCYAKVKILENKKIIGIYMAMVKDVETVPEVKFVFKDSESGSSRGLMCALDIYNKITEEDLTKGNVIAGTGSIDEDGNVGSIDGVKYKLIGAVKNKAKIFIVPDENYEEAQKIKNEKNYNIKLIKASNLHQVIEELRNR